MSTTNGSSRADRPLSVGAKIPLVMSAERPRNFDMIDLVRTLRQLDEMPSFVHSRAREIGVARCAQRPAPDAFSWIENVCHLRDVDREGYAVRVARMAEEVLP